MKTWIIAVAILGMLMIGSFVLVQAFSEPPEKEQTNTPYNYPTCGGGCSEGNTCGNPSCGIQTTGSCGCGR